MEWSAESAVGGDGGEQPPASSESPTPLPGTGGVDIVGAMERANQLSTQRRAARFRSTVIQVIVAIAIAAGVIVLLNGMLEEEDGQGDSGGDRADPAATSSLESSPPEAVENAPLVQPDTSTTPADPETIEPPTEPVVPVEQESAAAATVPPWQRAMETAQDHLDAAGSGGDLLTRLQRAYDAATILEVMPASLPAEQIPAWEAARGQVARHVALLELLSTGFF